MSTYEGYDHHVTSGMEIMIVLIYQFPNNLLEFITIPEICALVHLLPTRGMAPASNILERINIHQGKVVLKSINVISTYYTDIQSNANITITN